MKHLLGIVAVLCLTGVLYFSTPQMSYAPPLDTGTTPANDRLVPATSTMVTAWDLPRDPFADSLHVDSHLAEQIRWGFRLFTNTPEEAPFFTYNNMSCGNCHLNAGQREKALPLVGVSAMFPEYNKREGRLYSLEDRIVGCFMRSQNATGFALLDRMPKPGEGEYPSPKSKEVLALAAYITWLSSGLPVGSEVPWRGQNKIEKKNLLPLEQLDSAKGERLFLQHCAACHGDDGQGVPIGDKKAGPLWGSGSWNDGAGAARIYTLAGIIRYAMPYLNPGTLTDEEAQHIAAFINSRSRPVYPFKEKDYLATPLPPDAVYYLKSK